MILAIVEEDGADVIVVHPLQIDEVRLVRVPVHFRRTVGVDGAPAETDAVPVQPVGHPTRRDILPGGDDSIADLVGQVRDGLLDGHRLRIGRNARRSRLQDGGGVRVRGRQDDVADVDRAVLSRHRVSDRLNEDFRQLEEVQGDKGRRRVARPQRDHVGRQGRFRPGRKPQTELSPQGNGLVGRDIDRRRADLQFGPV